MKIGITGADGLIGFHLRALLRASQGVHETRLATRDTFRDSGSLSRFVEGLDTIFHCAGMNRGDEAEIERVNRQLAEELAAALERAGSRATVVYANSTHFSRDTPYGRGKRRAGDVLGEWGRAAGASVRNVVLPHVFGEFGRPFYNSVVSTFCHQLAAGERPRIDVDGELELIHAQGVARHFVGMAEDACGASPSVDNIRLNGRTLRVSEMLGRMQALLGRYLDNVVPDLRDQLDLELFNTLRSYLYPTNYPRPLKVHSDPRGDLFEAIKTDQGGQTFVSSSHPGITRGNHFHLRKIERFLVIGGEAEIKLRKLFTGEIHCFRVSGSQPAYVDIPTFHTHSITNVGSSILHTLFWANEIFDPNDSDTYGEAVMP